MKELEEMKERIITIGKISIKEFIDEETEDTKKRRKIKRECLNHSFIFQLSKSLSEKSIMACCKSHNKSIISEYPFRLCILPIVKVTVGRNTFRIGLNNDVSSPRMWETRVGHLG